MSLDQYIVEPNNQEDALDQSNVFRDIEFTVVDKKLNAVLITPACDLAYSKGSLLFCAVLNYEKLLPIEAEKSLSIDLKDCRENGCSNTKKNNLKEKLIEPFLNLNVDRYHWLGRLPGVSGYWYIDYNFSECLDPQKLDLENRIAIVKSPLRESIPTRYSNYLNRIGLPWENEDRLKRAEEILSSYLGGI